MPLPLSIQSLLSSVLYLSTSSRPATQCRDLLVLAASVGFTQPPLPCLGKNLLRKIAQRQNRHQANYIHCQAVAHVMSARFDVQEVNHVTTVLTNLNASTQHEIVKSESTKGTLTCSTAPSYIHPIGVLGHSPGLSSDTASRTPLISPSFLDRILQENAKLRARLPPSESPPVNPASTPSHHDLLPNDDEDAAQNRILEESDWFAHIRSSDTPIWIGEIADAAFATRFRQFASSSKAPSHIPRTQFASDDALRNLATTSPAWPSPACARLLIETALQFLRHNYHIIRRSEVLALSTCGFDHVEHGTSLASTAKMWALFAIGELRSSKCLSVNNNFPGLAYFAVASDAIRMINERPQLEVIETLLLLVSSKPSATISC